MFHILPYINGQLMAINGDQSPPFPNAKLLLCAILCKFTTYAHTKTSPPIPIEYQWVIKCTSFKTYAAPIRLESTPYRSTQYARKRHPIQPFARHIPCVVCTQPHGTEHVLAACLYTKQCHIHPRTMLQHARIVPLPRVARIADARRRIQPHMRTLEVRQPHRWQYTPYIQVVIQRTYLRSVPVVCRTLRPHFRHVHVNPDAH